MLNSLSDEGTLLGGDVLGIGVGVLGGGGSRGGGLKHAGGSGLEGGGASCAIQISAAGLSVLKVHARTFTTLVLSAP